MSGPNVRRIKKAVISAAGLGTRLRPLTRIIPKELLPLGRKPTAEFIMEELHFVGVNCIIFIVSPRNTSICDYFGDSACGGKVAVRYVVQQTQKGLADAILHAEEAVSGEDFIVALGDTVIISNEEVPPICRLMDSFANNGALAAITVERVQIQDAYRYGMVKPVREPDYPDFEIDSLVEKPAEGCSPSDYAIGGRYVFDSHIFDLIRRTEPGAGGEQQITDAIRLGISGGHRVWCAPVLPSERRYDIGSFGSYCEAFASMCMLDPELSGSVLRASVRNQAL